jgi:hypothetical protein
MKDIEAGASAKPRREKRLRSLTEAHRFNIKLAEKFVASFPLGREILDGVAKRPELIEATCPVRTA